MEDFDGWEVIPDEGFLQIHDDGGKRIYSRSYGPEPGSRCVYKDYFICPDSNSTQFVDNTQPQQEQESEYPRSRLVSIQLDNSPSPDLKIITEAPFDKTIINLKETEESDPDPVLQVVYKKMMESPGARTMKPPPFPLDSTSPLSPAAFQSMDDVKGEIFEIKKISISSPPNEKMIITDSGSVNNHNNGGGFNIWKWSLTTGIGAICSFGIATATVCIIFFGTHHRNTTNQQQQSKEKRKLQFHMYSDEKKQKEGAGIRGSGKGQITVGGGYYDQLFE